MQGRVAPATCLAGQCPAVATPAKPTRLGQAKRHGASNLGHSKQDSPRFGVRQLLFARPGPA